MSGGVRVADAAEYLVMSRGASGVWLSRLGGSQIIAYYEGARAADILLSGFREESGGRFINPMTGLRMTGTVSDVERTYTLEQMRSAYRQGFLAATDRQDAAEQYFNCQQYSDDREVSLAVL
jgi:hypothetical protein